MITNVSRLLNKFLSCIYWIESR